MRDIYIVTDDLTGALDTGVQFSNRGTSVTILSQPASSLIDISTDDCVLVECLDSRHLPPNEAAILVSQAVHRAIEAGFLHIYKKTDSALRGNIGAELAAVQETVGEILEFVPAYPALGRTTVDGLQLLNGVPIHETSFASDPFEPVKTSKVADIIETQTSIPCYAEYPKQGPAIVIHDAKTDEDLFAIARELSKQKRLRCVAGCAGFANVLSRILPLETSNEKIESSPISLLVVCGSVHPNAVVQMEAGQAAGAYRIALGAEKRRSCNVIRLPEKENKKVLACNAQGQTVIVDVCDGYFDCDVFQQQQIAYCLAEITKQLLQDGLHATILATGGDTLSALLKVLDSRRIYGLKELDPGVVLFACECSQGVVHMISKAGSFGSDDLIIRTQNHLRNGT